MQESLEDCVPLDEIGLVMYQIYFTKAALKQLPNLKAAKLDAKAKALIEILKENPLPESTAV